MLKYFSSILLILPLLLFAHDDEFGCIVKDPKGRYREHNVDFQKMTLSVHFEPEIGKVNGNVKYTFIPKQKVVDTLFLDAPGIEIHRVLVDKQATEFYTNDKGLVIKFNKQLAWDNLHELKIEYTAFPKKGLYFIGWDDETDQRRKQIWTQGQGIDNRHWIPSYDDVNDKLITETIITFDCDYEVISNGTLVHKTEHKDCLNTWHYAMSKPHVVYLVMIAIGEYDYKDMVAENGIISRQYFYPDKPETFAPTYQYSNEMMDWMEEELGVPYPWEIYRNVPVEDFIYGAMENTTATVFGDFYLQDERAALERNYISTNAHELTHQWFGDYITEWSSQHHWLHESFATHYAKHFMKFVHGEDEYQWIRRQEMESSWRAAEQNSLPIVHTDAGSARHYPKGSLVIDMMRYILGEEQFKRGITNFLKNYPYDLVDTHLFYLEFMKSLGINLDWFFEQWLYKGGEPHYRLSYNAEESKTVVFVEQIHELNEYTGLFKMPIDIEVHYKDGSHDSKTIWIEKQKETIVILNKKNKKVDYLLFDPNWNVLKKLDFKKSYEELIAQASKAQNMIDRYEAVKALKEIELDQKRKDLASLFINEDFYAIRASIVGQLVNDEHKVSKSIIEKALKDEHFQVRRVVLDKSTKIDKKHIEFFEKLLSDPSYVNTAKALTKLSFEFPEKKSIYLEQTKNEIGKSKNVRIPWLKIASEENKNHLTELTDYASNSYEFRTRISAINTLSDLNHFNKNLLKNLMDAYLGFNRYLSSIAKNALIESAVDEINRKMIEGYLEKLDDSENEKIVTLKEKISG